MFGRRKQHVRTDVSLVTQWIQQATLARMSSGRPVPYDELPITQGVVNLVADGIAAMDLYAVDKKGKAVATEFPVLEQPNPDEDREDTIHKAIQSLMWKGNIYAMPGPVDPGTGAADTLNILNPNRVGWQPDPMDDLRVASWTIDGAPLARSRITHVKMNDDPRRGPLGESPLVRCSTALGMYGWAYRYIADFFANGGNPSSYFKSKLNGLGNDKITELVNEWISARQQTRPAFLPDFLDLEVPPNNGELAAVIEVLDFASAEIARLLSMPTTVVNAPVKGYSLTYANVGDEFKRWLAFGLGTTWINRIERLFTRQLPTGLRAHLDPSPLFPTDLFAEPLGPDTPTAALPPAPAQAPAAPPPAQEVPV
jgi:phage portal protein BeeE